MVTGSYFTLSELTYSRTAILHGINNTPDTTSKLNIQSLIDDILDPARSLLGSAITVTSGYRSAELNAKIGSLSSNSQHITGEAADIKCTKSKMKILFSILLKLPYDQLIYEKQNGIFHVSHKRIGTNRGQVLYTTDLVNYISIKSNWENYFA